MYRLFRDSTKYIDGKHVKVHCSVTSILCGVPRFDFGLGRETGSCIK